MLDRARWAARAYASYDKPAVDRIVATVAQVAADNAGRYAEWAVKETGLGVPEHKLLKNLACSTGLVETYAQEDFISPRIDPTTKIVSVPRPAGVVLALTPSTNPVATVYFKILLALMTRNAVIVSPHPLARECCADAARVLGEAAVAAGAPDGIVQVVEEPTIPLIESLMSDPRTDLIVATGGPAVVHASYKSGNPAIGVGPGNVPVFVDHTADLPAAARRIVESKSFDNSILCTNESVLIVEEAIRDQFLTALAHEAAHLPTPTPPPHATSTPPLHATHAPPPHTVHAPPPHATHAPPLHAAGAAPPHATHAPPLHATGAAPPHATHAPPPHATGAAPPYASGAASQYASSAAAQYASGAALDASGLERLRAVVGDRECIGRSAEEIAARAGLRVPDGTKVLLAPFGMAVPEEPLAREKLMPVLGLLTVPSAQAGIRAAQAVLRISGRGHSAAIHSTDARTIMSYGAAVQVLRVAVNAGNSLGSAGITTGLAPSMTIGTGFVGGSSVGENLTPSHLINWTRLAFATDAAFPDFSGLDPWQAPQGAVPRYPHASNARLASDSERQNLASGDGVRQNLASGDGVRQSLASGDGGRRNLASGGGERTNLASGDGGRQNLASGGGVRQNPGSGGARTNPGSGGGERQNAGSGDGGRQELGGAPDELRAEIRRLILEELAAMRGK